LLRLLGTGACETYSDKHQQIWLIMLVKYDVILNPNSCINLLHSLRALNLKLGPSVVMLWKKLMRTLERALAKIRRMEESYQKHEMWLRMNHTETL
jgi:hypothetical protein